MSCAYDKERLTGYFDGELEAAEKADVEKHISACSECLRELGEIKSAARLVKTLPRRRAPRSIAEGVSREIAAAGRVHSMAKYRKTILWTFAAAAAFLVVANVSYFAGREGAPPASETANGPTAPRIALVQTGAPKNADLDESLRRRQAPEADKVGKSEPATKAPTAGEFRKKADALEEEKPKSEGQKDAGKRDENRAPAAKPAAEPSAPAKPQAPPALAAKTGEMLAKAKEEKAAAPVPAPASALPPAAEKKESAPALRELERARPALQQEKQLQDAAAAAPVKWTVSAPRASTVTRAKAEEILVAKGWLSGPLAAANAHGQQNNKLAGKANESPAPAPLAVELTAAQFAELKKLLEAQSDVQLAVGGPEDGQLAQLATQGGGRGGAAPGARAAGVPSGGAKAAEGDAKGAAKPAAEQQPALGADLKKADPASDGRKDRESGEKFKEAVPADQAKAGAFGRRENESRQKFVLYFQDVPAGKK